MAKPPLSATDYLAREFRNNSSLQASDPDLYRVIEQGLRSSEGARWVEAAEQISHGSRGWAALFLEKVLQDHRALCWMVAAGHYECWTCGSNPAPWLQKLFQKIPEIERHFSELETLPDPWLSGMAAWGRRVLSGEDKWIGQRNR